MLVSQASAATQTLLPSSSLYDGYTYYGETITMQNGSTSYMQGRIDFAVYDTLGGNEWECGDDGVQGTDDDFANPGNGRYVYAYQIINDYEGYSEVAIQSFSIFGLNGAEISVFADSVGTEMDAQKGQEASGTDLSDTTVTWNFLHGTTDYTIGIDEHSVFLIFSSDYSWTEGDYSLEAYDTEFPVAPGADGTADSNPTPEPVTIALLGFGSLIAFVRNKRK